MSLDESLIICIHMICNKYKIENYKINDDGSIDVIGDVDLGREGLTELPLQFRNVTGGFNCWGNLLTTLQGAPQTVGKDFDCFQNHLTTLEGAPHKVGWSLICTNNMLTSLKGAPRVIGRDFVCYNNPDLSEEERADYMKRIGR